MLLTFAAAAFAAFDADPIKAYQTKFGMFFSVWKPDGLPPAWFATFDGYPVREFTKNHWIYGIIGRSGEIIDSEILVGSVDPRAVLMLSPLPGSDAPKSRKNVIDSLLKALDLDCNRFGVVRTDASYTPLAWRNGTSDGFLWNGQKWTPLAMQPGETFAESFERAKKRLAELLRKNSIRWTSLDSVEFADFIKGAGHIWVDDFKPESAGLFGLVSASDVGGSDGSISGSAPSGGGSIGGGRAPSGGGGWDTGR